jgi:hypothetical protein
MAVRLLFDDGATREDTVENRSIDTLSNWLCSSESAWLNDNTLSFNEIVPNGSCTATGYLLLISIDFEMIWRMESEDSSLVVSAV